MVQSLVGHTLGKYDIVGLLGKGGMASVYRGYQRDVDRYVAVKVLPPHPGQDTQYVQRFRLEARTIARLQHPYILPLYDYGDQEGVLYLIMPFVEGGTLRDRIEEGPLPLPAVERILNQMASALDYAHRNGMIHRDIKPDNILLNSEGDALLADFGIIKLVEGQSHLTPTGGVVGTPAYMAPEQAQGLPAAASSDIYSLGVVVYEMLAGTLPYTADTPMQILFQHITAPVPDINEVVRDLPPGIEPAMRRVLAKEPEARFVTAGDFAAAFSRALRQSEGGTVRSAQRTETAGERAVYQTPSPVSKTPVSQDVQPSRAGETAPVAGRMHVSNIWLPLVGVVMLALLAVVIGLLVISLNRGPVVVVANPTAATPGQASPDTTIAASAPTAVASPTRRPTVTTVPTFGSASFGTTHALGDTVNLRLENLPSVAEGSFYVAWLSALASGQTMRLGRLSVDAFGNGVLSFTDPEERVLPSAFNAVLITREDRLGDSPTGDVVYSGYVPPELSDGLSEILVSSSVGRPGESLLADALAEADIATNHAGMAAGSDTLGGMQAHIEHVLNILQGTTDDLNGDGRPENPGLGLGLPLLLGGIDQSLRSVSDVSDAWPNLQSNLELVNVCLANARGRMDNIVATGRQVLGSDSLEEAAPQAQAVVRLVAELVNGVDLNGNGQVEAFEGECGLQQVGTYGAAVGGMVIVQGPPPSS